jgi:hypothetical protein
MIQWIRNSKVDFSYIEFMEEVIKGQFHTFLKTFSHSENMRGSMEKEEEPRFEKRCN